MLFKDLKAYQHARRLSVLSRSLIKRLPDSERDLADQWRRACNSIALNLAEGVSRRGSKEFRRFTDMARGSLVEVEAIIDLVQHLVSRCCILRFSLHNTVSTFPRSTDSQLL